MVKRRYLSKLIFILDLLILMTLVGAQIQIQVDKGATDDGIAYYYTRKSSWDS